MAAAKKPIVKKTARPGPKRRKAAPKPKDNGGRNLLVGAGIGSAAIVAALLFATRGKGKKKPAPAKDAKAD